MSLVVSIVLSYHEHVQMSINFQMTTLIKGNSLIFFYKAVLQGRLRVKHNAAERQ